MMEHYFSKKPKSRPEKNIISYEGLQFHTSSSVFSKKAVDKGTALLIKEPKIKPNSKILDIGCGYGIVGISISKLYPETEVTMSDINERAIALTKKNLKLNNAKATVIKSNLFENIKENFDIILSNPPQHAGKDTCIKIIKDSFAHLNKGGSLQLVVRHQKGGKSLSKKMEETFGNVESIARKSGYHIYYSKKN
jgi:16S rRNA (guanine1207-N2)-methyltransferase